MTTETNYILTRFSDMFGIVPKRHSKYYLMKINNLINNSSCIIFIRIRIECPPQDCTK